MSYNGGTELIYNSVNKEMSDRYEAMTLNYTVDRPYYRLQVYGWMFDNAGENLYITLLDTDGTVYSVNTYDSRILQTGFILIESAADLALK